MAADPSRTRRNVIFALILVAVTAVVFTNRFSPFFDDDPEVETVATSKPPPPPPSAPPPPAAPVLPTAPAPPEAPPLPLLGLSFQAFAERYEAVRDSFRARDQLAEEVVDRRMEWQGYVRSVSKQTNAFYVSLTPQDSYSSVSALATFPHTFEEQLYALRQGDLVRFEGTISRAGMALMIEGTAIEKVE